MAPWFIIAQQQLQAKPKSGDTVELWAWIGVLMVVVVAGCYAIIWLRKRLVENPSTSQAKVSFTLDDLRTMHALGQISDGEFEKARAKMVAKMRGTSEESAEADQAVEPSDDSPPADESSESAGDDQGEEDSPDQPPAKP